MRELALPNQTVKSRHVLVDISPPGTRINLSFVSLKTCGLAGRFAYNFNLVKADFENITNTNTLTVGILYCSSVYVTSLTIKTQPT